MKIAAELLIKEKDISIDALKNENNFCDFEKVELLRKKEFAKQYVITKYEKIKLQKAEQQVIEQVYEHELHKDDLKSINGKLSLLKSGDNKVKEVVNLTPNDRFDPEKPEVSIAGIKHSANQTIAVEMIIIDLKPQVYNYGYKISWSRDLDWGGLKAERIKDLILGLGKFKPISDDDKLSVKFACGEEKYNLDKPVDKPSLSEIYQALFVETQEDQQEVSEIIGEYETSCQGQMYI